MKNNRISSSVQQNTGKELPGKWLPEEQIRQDRLIMDTIPHLIWTAGPDGSVEYCNEQWLSYTGLTEVQIQGNGWMQAVHPDDAERTGQIWAQACHDAVSYAIEQRLRRSDGAYRWFLTLAMPVKDRNGNVIKWYGTCTDITERKQIEDAQLFLLHCGNRGDDFFQSLARYLAESLSMDYVCIDRLEGDCLSARTVAVYFDGKFEDNVTYTLKDTPCGDVVGETVCCYTRDVRHMFPKDAVLQDMVAESYVGVTLWSYTGYPIGLIAIIGRHPLQNPRLAESLLKLVAVRAAGELERRQAEETLRKSEGKYRSIFENAVEGIFQVAPDGRFLSVNPAFSKMFGYSSAEEMMENITDIGDQIHVIKDDQKRLVNMIDDHGSVKGFEAEVYRKDGSRFWISINARSVRDIDGAVLYYEGTNMDITDRKHMEEELLKTKKLESLGLLAGGIAHDFNNLLQAIMSGIGLAKMYLPRESKAFNAMLMTDEAVKQACQLSQRLLTFAKGGEPFRQVIRIGQVIREAAGIAMTGAKTACECLVPVDLNLVRADSGQIMQVIINLLINAREAMPEGGDIRITAENIAIEGNFGIPLREGPYVKISVQDHGLGIPADILPRIFDPYFSTKDKHYEKGMGLGLTVCHSIIKKHDGCITVESETGKGTIFHVFIPAHVEIMSREDNENGCGVPENKGRVLIMDDDLRVRYVVGATLQHKGYAVEYAANGDDAIRLYREALGTKKRFDLVILDLTVQGGMGGEQTIKKLKELDPLTKAVITSGYSSSPVMMDFADYGFVASIAKPFDNAGLIDLVTKCIAMEPS